MYVFILRKEDTYSTRMNAARVTKAVFKRTNKRVFGHSFSRILRGKTQVFKNLRRRDNYMQDFMVWVYCAYEIGKILSWAHFLLNRSKYISS